MLLPPSPRRAAITVALLGLGLVAAMAGLEVTENPAHAHHTTAAAFSASTAPVVYPGSNATARTKVRTSTGRRPNVIVVMIDDARTDDLRYMPITRHYLKARGLVFHNSFSPYPLCCPARTSFLLGQYAHNHGVLYHDSPYGFGAINDSLTIAGRMQAAGYQTALVGKYLNRYGIMKSKVTGGSSVHYVPAGWTDWMVGLDNGWHKAPDGTYDYFDFTQNINGHTVYHRGEYSSHVIADETIGLIGKYHRRNRPFFMWVTPVAPHFGGPHEADDPVGIRTSRGRLEHIGTPARPDWVKGRFDAVITHAAGVRADGKPSEADIRDKPLDMRHLPEMTHQEKIAVRTLDRQRAEAVYAWDRQFGRIIRKLKETGEYRDTVIMFTSDNGYYLGEHRIREGKIRAHEPALDVPLLVAGPGIPHGARYVPIDTFDLTATVLDIAGARPLPNMDGFSRLPEMVGPDQPWTSAVVTEGLLKDVHRTVSGFPHGLTTSGLRTGRYKLIEYADGSAELYDLWRDPLELHSHFGAPDYRAIQAEMVATWKQYRTCKVAQCRVPLPANLQTTPAFLAREYANTQRQITAYYG